MAIYRGQVYVNTLKSIPAAHGGSAMQDLQTFAG